MSGKDELTIIIGSKEYEVIYKHPVKVDGNEQWGFIDYGQCKIYIDNKLCEQMQFNALNHEIIHAILYEIGSPLHQDEQFVEAFGNLLSQVLKENFGIS